MGKIWDAYARGGRGCRPSLGRDESPGPSAAPQRGGQLSPRPRITRRSTSGRVLERKRAAAVRARSRSRLVV